MSFLNKNIINFDSNIFGLDLSDISVKVLQLERNGSIERVRSYSSVEIPVGSIEDGMIVRRDEVISAIKLAVKNSLPKKISSRKVICSLPESKAFLRIISIPRMKEEEAREAIKWEMEASIPLSIDQVYFDWQFMKDNCQTEKEEGNEKKQDVLTVAVSKEVVDNLMEVLKEAGLEVYGLELESVAGVRSLISHDCEQKDVSLIVDLGSKRTSFIIAEGNVPYFTSSIPFSSEGITDAVAKYFGIKNEEAEKMKINQGIVVGQEDPMLNAVEPLLNSLTNEIEKTIDFYTSTSKNSLEVKKIVLSGGGANLKGLVPYLAKKISREISMGDPWTNLKMGSDLPIISKEISASYSTVVGLALRGLNYGNKN